MSTPVNFDSDVLPDVNSVENEKVFDSSGKSVPFSNLIRSDENVVIVFIRHFNCGSCQDYVRALGEEFPKDRPNTQLIIIGCGESKNINAYKDLLKCPFDIYADPTLNIYEKLGMTLKNLDRGPTENRPAYVKRSFPAVVFGSMLDAFRMGLLIGSGDVRQLGGEFIFKNGQVTFAHRMRHTLDHVDVKDLVKELDS